MERKFGAVLTVGYLTFRLDVDPVHRSGEAVQQAYDFATSGDEVFGVFNMPASPGHRYAAMRVNPTHVVGVVELPEDK